MKKLPTLAVAGALAFAAHAAFADDNSMSRFGGESYVAFQAAQAASPAARASAGTRILVAHDDNSMSRWNGDSYKAFAESASDAGKVTLASLRRPSLPAERLHMTRLPRTPIPTSPFSDQTG